MKKGTVYFFTGLSGAGKTTLGGEFYRRLKSRRNDAVLLDGDQVREVYGSDFGYSTAERRKCAGYDIRLCKMLSDQGIDVVYCAISMYDEVRAWNRANIENYKEIYVKVKMETLYKRDQKGLYSGNVPEVVGVDLPWDEPKTPDFIVENDGQEAPGAIVDRLERQLGLRE